MVGEDQTHQSYPCPPGMGVSSIPGEKEEGERKIPETNETYCVLKHQFAKWNSNLIIFIFIFYLQWVFEQETFPQMRPPPEDQDGIGSSGEEYRRALRFGGFLAFENVVSNPKVKG